MEEDPAEPQERRTALVSTPARADGAVRVTAANLTTDDYRQDQGPACQLPSVGRRDELPTGSAPNVRLAMFAFRHTREHARQVTDGQGLLPEGASFRADWSIMPPVRPRAAGAVGRLAVVVEDLDELDDGNSLAHESPSRLGKRPAHGLSHAGTSGRVVVASTGD